MIKNCKTKNYDNYYYFNWGRFQSDKSTFPAVPVDRDYPIRIIFPYIHRLHLSLPHEYFNLRVSIFVYFCLSGFNFNIYIDRVM